MAAAEPVRKQIGYVVALEPLWTPILQSQVIDVLALAARESGVKVTLIWFRAAGPRPPQLAEARRTLAANGIDLEDRPVLARSYVGRWWSTWAIGLQMALWLAALRRRRPVDAYHCRSYLPAVGVALLRRAIPSVRLVFDPRSPYPEENVAAGRFGPASLDLRFWKATERGLVRASEVIVCVTEAMRRELERTPTAARWAVIPNNVAMADPPRDPRAPDRTTLCYMGDLSTAGWNSVWTYIEVMERVLALRPDHRFRLVVTAPGRAGVEAALATRPRLAGTFEVATVPRAEVAATIAGCAAGMQIMRHVDSRMGIKTAEYLAAGLPVLTSENVVGAAELVRAHGVGFVLRADYGNLPEALAWLDEVVRDREAVRRRCVEVARATFSTPVVASRYAALYAQLP